jgi:hypothetical protein
MIDKQTKPPYLRPWTCPKCGHDCSGTENDTRDSGDCIGYPLQCQCGCEFTHWEEETRTAYGVEVDGQTYEYPPDKALGPAERITIPLYNPETQESDESQPQVLTLRRETGLRVVFGDPADPDVPDILIERQPDGWQIMVHPDDGDPLCRITLTDKTASVYADTGDKVLSVPRRGAVGTP